MFEDDNQEVETSEETQDEVEVVEAEENDEDVEEAEPQIDWEARAKKAEAAIEKAKQKAKTAPVAKGSSDLSAADIIALSKANIEPDDIDEVLSYAKYKGLSVKDALNSPVVKATIAENAELRKSASAVNIGTGRRASSGGISDEKLLANAKNGIMPESEADIARLFALRRKN